MSEVYEPFPPFAEWADLPVDTDTFRRYAILLAQDRAEASPEALERAVRIATRYAAVDTGAVEQLYTTDRGFTRTVAMEAASWDAIAQEKGEAAVELIKDQITAYEMVLDLATHFRPITEVYVKELHAQLCASQDTYEVVTPVGPQRRPLPKGVYKTDPNNPTVLATDLEFQYAPPGEVPSEMRRFIEEVNSEQFDLTHCVLQAAYLHYAFVRIHPFADGNGRVSRALASISLYRELSMPFFFFADQRDAYLDALAAADTGDPGAFVAFVYQRALDMIGLVRLSLTLPASEGGGPNELRRLLTSHGGLTHAEIDAVAQRITTAVDQALDRKMGVLDLPLGVSSFKYFDSVAPSGYRSVVGVGRGLQISSPAVVQKQVTIGTTVAMKSDEKTALRIASSLLPERPLDVPLREVEPTLSEQFALRLDLWLDANLDLLVQQFTSAVAEELRARGYR